MKLKTIPKEGFYFDEEKHAYWLDGKRLTGVTTILGVLAKPALIQWAADMAVNYIKEKGNFIKETRRYTEITEALLEEARKAHTKKRDASADIGKLAHKWCEMYIKGENPQKNESLSIMTDNFLKWVDEAKPKFLASEKVVYSKEHWFAGTLDFIAEIEGKNYLGDIKTSSGIYPEMFWQTSGYQLALNETEPGLKIDGHIIVNIKKDGTMNVKTAYDYKESVQGFLAALTIYRALNKQI